MIELWGEHLRQPVHEGLHALRQVAPVRVEQRDRLTRFALPANAAYAAMKGGVEVLTRYLAKELGARGIAVNVVAPGAIETDFGGGAVRDNAQLNGFVAAQTTLGRAGLPDDIGGVVSNLLRPDKGWINGQRIEASRGMFL